MKQILGLFSIFFLLYSCSDQTKNESSILQFVPQNSAVVINIDNMDQLNSSLKNNDFVKQLVEKKTVVDFKQKLRPISSLNAKDNAILSLTEVGRNNFEYTLIAKKEEITVANEDARSSLSTLDYNNTKITKITKDELENFRVVLDSTFIQSSSQLLIENIIRNHQNNYNKVNPKLQNAFATVKPNRAPAIYINNETFVPLIKNVFPDIREELFGKDLSDWLQLEMEIDQNSISFNGVAYTKDSIPKVMNLFKGTVPSENKILEIAPLNTDAIISFSYNDWEIVKDNLANYDVQKNRNRTTLNELMANSTEFSQIFKGEEKAIIINTHDGITAFETLNNVAPADTFRQIPVHTVTNGNFIVNALRPLLSSATIKYMAVVENHLIFTASRKMLENIIANYQNGNVLAKTANSAEMMNDLSDAASIFMIGINPGFKELLIANASNQHKKELEDLSLENYPMFGLQLVQDGSFAHVHGIIKKNKPETITNSVAQMASITLDGDLATRPQLVVNHRSKQKEIVVQDTDNHLYLISNEGKILWKKQLKGKIQGDIQQVDLYRNGRLQLAFTTTNGFLILDRNGKEVPPFNMSYEGGSSNAIAVFDYERNKNYRILVSRGKRMLMYDRKGKIVNGFTFKNAKSNILTSPKHIRIGDKDYIVFAEENGKLQILDRRGKTRVDVKEKIEFSDNDILQYQNKFTTTDKNGNLIQVDQKGNLIKTPLKLEENHYITSTNKTLVTLSENELTIKGNKAELDYGIYSKPKLFYINNKIYVTTTDTQSQKVYLFDSNAKLMSNFPVYGSGGIDMENIDKDPQLEFVVKGEKNSVLIYKIN